MNDDFLYQLRPPVRKEFAQRLYQHISTPKGENRMKQAFTVIWKFALASMLGLSLLFAFSGSVRASVLQWIRNIGGFNVTGSETAPALVPDPAIPTVVYTPQPLSQALQGLPFTFSMPAYIPDGYHLRDDVVIAESKTWVSMQWSDERGWAIVLLVQQDWDLSLTAGLEGAEQIQIHDEPALLIRGRWNSDGSAWDLDGNEVRIYWRHQGVIYNFYIQDYPPDRDQDSQIQELMRMAESVP